MPLQLSSFKVDAIALCCVPCTDAPVKTHQTFLLSPFLHLIDVHLYIGTVEDELADVQQGSVFIALGCLGPILGLKVVLEGVHQPNHVGTALLIQTPFFHAAGAVCVVKTLKAVDCL